ncbi:hypothetical protein [Nocardia veterana]|uniref:Uncharacterized protein n=1 Tax=Nocardia veterana TaxID=132249 RepID=A0A7X6RLJ9_9NOCA|nr:hypothetical protein [Nocardia veterana]NKY89809.1 hypothetical protein [Nocardia veterana]
MKIEDVLDAAAEEAATEMAELLDELAEARRSAVPLAEPLTSWEWIRSFGRRV